ncbi:hypothetical protein LCGC14_3154380, partial [marine sediment metagenome]
MKPLFFVVSLLFSWQLLATESASVAPQAKTEAKTAATKAGEDKVAKDKAELAKATESASVEKPTESELQDSPAVITLTPELVQATAPEAVESTQPITATNPNAPQVDTSKVLGNETAKPAAIPKTQQEKAVAVAQAEQAVIQAKEALTLKQQVKAKQSRESLAVIEQLIKAYNARNIDAFISIYDENVEFYAFPNELLFKG